MNEDQADDIIGLLGELLQEMRGMRSDFMEFTGYNTTKMSTLSEDITGPTRYHIGDIHDRLNEIDLKLLGIELNTQS